MNINFLVYFRRLLIIAVKKRVDVVGASDLLNKIREIKNSSLSTSDYLIAISILRAAPAFSLLKKFVHLELKKYSSKVDMYSIRMDRDNNRLTFKKVSDDAVSVISIVLNKE